MDIERITEDEFRALFPTIARAGASDQALGWFRYRGDTLGVVLEDKVERDYSFVLMRRLGDDFEAVDSGGGFRTVGEACGVLHERMKRRR